MNHEKRNLALNDLNGAIKVGQEEHINQLHKKGHLFCNTIKYFREIEKTDFNRYDRREGAVKTKTLENPEDYIIHINGQEIPGKLSHIEMNEYDSIKDFYKLFCLFRLKENHATGKPFIDDRILNFGKKSLLILNLEEFIKRVRQELAKQNLKCLCKCVKYYTELSANRNLTPFDKPYKFSYQEEYRILIAEDRETALSVEIGSIEDISTIIDAHKLKRLKMRPKKD